VRDHVVQIARDPRPLPRRADLRLPVALDLQRREPRAPAHPAVGEQRRHQHLRADDGGPDHEAVEHAGKRDARRHHDAADERDPQPDRLEPARTVHDQEVEGDQRREVGHQHVSVTASCTRQVADTIANTTTGARGPNASGATSASDTRTSSVLGATEVS
jgi:hypothetical protein